MTKKAEQRERTHEEILRSASRLLRERGIAASSVAHVMEGAGLTVGGFYAHFASKEALFDETLRRTARETWTALLGEAKGGTPRERAASVLRRYLSKVHRDSPDKGCPFPAVVGEVPREGEPFRDGLTGEVNTNADALAAFLQPGAQPGAPVRARALGLLALMVGGLSLARAVRGPLSDEILRACRAFGEEVFHAASTPDPMESK